VSSSASITCCRSTASSLPQHFLYFFPLPHGHGSFLPTMPSPRSFSFSLIVAGFVGGGKGASGCSPENWVFLFQQFPNCPCLQSIEYLTSQIKTRKPNSLTFEVNEFGNFIVQL